MIAINQYYQKWQLIPRPARLFLLKGLVLLILWKSIYLAFLLPTRLLDKPLTNSVGTATAYTLNLFSNTHAFTSKNAINRTELEGIVTNDPVMTVYLNNKPTLSIADPCNALELFVLFAGFIICLPAKASRKIAFISTGLILIWIINVLRCVGLIEIFLYNPKYTHFSHHYTFKFIVYGFIFLLWMLFTKKLINDKSN